MGESRKSEAAKLLGHFGGKARAENLSEAELSAIGKLGNQSRNANLTPEQRSEIARKAVLARIRKHGQKRHKKGQEQK